MAHFWKFITNDDFKGWSLLPQVDAFDEFELPDDPDSPVRLRRNQKNCFRVIVLREKSEKGEEVFVLISNQVAKQKIRINGDHLHAGVLLLLSRDETLIFYVGGGSQRLYFSAERKASIYRFNENDGILKPGMNEILTIKS